MSAQTSVSPSAAAAAAPPVPSSVVLAGTAQIGRLANKNSGNVTLKANADGSLSETWDVSSGRHSSTTTSFLTGRGCQETDEKGNTTTVNQSRCLRPVPWFAPWIATKTVLDNITTVLDGSSAQDTAAGQQRMLYTLVIPKPDPSKLDLTQGYTTLAADNAVLVTYDVKTHLPLRIDYSEVASPDPTQKIEFYVLYQDYREEAGYMIPHRIQRYVQRALQADLTINSVTIQ